MAERKLQVLLKKIMANGDIDHIFFKSRAKDVMVDESGTQTLADIASKVNNSAEGATKVEDSSTNGNIKINGVEKNVYEHPTSGVTAGTYNSVTVNAQGHVTSASKVTNWTGSVSGDISNGTNTITQATTRANLTSGEKLSTSLGKIKKYFADLGSMAFTSSVGTSNLDSTLTTFYNAAITTDNVTDSTSITAAGWVADARAIASLQKQINTINSKLISLLIPNTAAAHNSYYRGKDITDLYNSGEFSRQVAAGTFNDIFPGDYIVKTKVIDGTTYTDHFDLIVELDPYYGKNDGSNRYVTTHHVGIIPLQRLGLSPMNETNDTTGGFYNSYMHQTTLPKYLTGYKNAYGDSHLVTFGELITNTVNNSVVAPGYAGWKGVSNGWVWHPTKITLLSEVQVYGSSVWGGGYDVGEACNQLAAFRMRSEIIHNSHGDWWLRAVASSSHFALADYDGRATYTGASSSLYVRPLLLLC